MSPKTESHDSASLHAKDDRSIWKSGLLAGILAAALNTAIFVLAVVAGVFPSLTFQPDTGAQMSVEPILLVSVLGALGGAGAFALLRSRVANPVPVFLKVVIVVLLLSFAAPFAIPGTAVVQAIVLNVMHIVVAGGVVWAVYRTKPNE